MPVSWTSTASAGYTSRPFNDDQEIETGVRIMTVGTLTLITAEVNQPTTFVFDGPRQKYYSSRPLIQKVLLSAFFKEAKVEIDLVENSDEIKRVHPFDPGNPRPGPGGPDRVTRIATQRNIDGNDHLEIFLVRGEDPVQAFNVFDPLLQQLLTSAYDATRANQGPMLRVALSQDQREIEAAQLGQVP
jgi:hypothetical protein